MDLLLWENWIYECLNMHFMIWKCIFKILKNCCIKYLTIQCRWTIWVLLENNKNRWYSICPIWNYYDYASGYFGVINSSLQNWPKIQSVRKSMILRTGFCVFTAFFFVYELFGVKKLVFGWGIERAGIEMREVDKCFDWRNNLYMIV